MKQFTVNKNDSGQRLDKFLTKLMPKLPYGTLCKSLRKNCVKIDGKHIRDGSFKLSEGQLLSLYFNDELFEVPEFSLDFMKITPKLNIIYEDDNILLADKPQGICVHEDATQNVDNLLSHIKSYLYRKGEFDPKSENTFAPALANRIDKGTGGIVIAAKNAESLRILNEKLKNREIKKFYLCLAAGHFEKQSGEISGYILRDKNTRTVSVFDTPTGGAKNMLTYYRVLEEYPLYSLVEAELKTGRTHQIRASFAHIGHPLLGDRKYAPPEQNRKFPFLYQALYSYKLIFDFSEDAGILQYLSGREFEIKDVRFAKKRGL